MCYTEKKYLFEDYSNLLAQFTGNTGDSIHLKKICKKKIEGKPYSAVHVLWKENSFPVPSQDYHLLQNKQGGIKESMLCLRIKRLVLYFYLSNWPVVWICDPFCKGQPSVFRFWLPLCVCQQSLLLPGDRLLYRTMTTFSQAELFFFAFWLELCYGSWAYSGTELPVQGCTLKGIT